MHPRPLLIGQLVSPGLDLLEHLGALRIVGDAGDRGTGEEQVGVLGAHVLGERTEHPDGILEPVPA